MLLTPAAQGKGRDTWQKSCQNTPYQLDLILHIFALSSLTKVLNHDDLKVRRLLLSPFAKTWEIQI